jgi:hypothetical protein
MERYTNKIKTRNLQLLQDIHEQHLHPGILIFSVVSTGPLHLDTP